MKDRKSMWDRKGDRIVRYLLSISELAKLKNITSETLRHYDRIDLLKPDYVTKSGWIYRCAESACPVFWKSPVRKGEIIVPDR